MGSSLTDAFFIFIDHAGASVLLLSCFSPGSDWFDPVNDTVVPSARFPRWKNTCKLVLDLCY